MYALSNGSSGGGGGGGKAHALLLPGNHALDGAAGPLCESVLRFLRSL